MQGLYELFAMLHHLDRSPQSGHYIAYIRAHNGQWCVTEICVFACPD